MNSEIEQRLHRLEAIEAIRTCIYSYAAAGDRRNDPVLVKRLFAQDARYSIPGMFDFIGRDAILDGLGAVARDVVLWAFHHPGGPIVEIEDDGRTAKAFWWMWIPVNITSEHGPELRFEAGHYNAELVATEAGWQFLSLLFEPKFSMPMIGTWQAMQGDFQWLI